MIGGGGVQDAGAVRARILTGAATVAAVTGLSGLVAELVAELRRPRPGGSDELGN